MSNKIYFGANKTSYYDDSNMLSCNAISSVTVIGDTIAVDEIHATVRGIPTGSSTPVTSIAYGTPMWFYIGSTLAGKYYFSAATKVSKNQYDLIGISAIGLLDAEIHDGGIYSGTTVEDILDDIIGDSIDYTVDSEIADIEVNGWLPVASKKQNLHQLLLALGIDIKKDSNGDVVFYFNNGNSEKTIPDGRIYDGGSVSYEEPASRIEVTEHAFQALSSDTEETLFDNTDDDEVASVRVEFTNAPVHDLRVTGTLTINSSSVNFAVVTGKGVLYGKPYTHTTAIIAAESASAETTNVKTVTDCTLISSLNSGNVAQRLLAYFSSAEIISTDIVVSNEHTGERVTMSDPFGDTRNAFVKQMDVTASTVVRAACQLICGYTPVYQGNTYHESVVLTGSGTYTVPSGKYYITAILIAGGTGGTGGGKGSNGNEGERGTGSWTTYSGGAGGTGGSGGSGGAGGKIYQKVIAVTPGDTFSYSCGTGGAGGAANGGAGTAGTHTTFGDYDSDDGSSAVAGITNRYSGTTYGAKGDSGTAGGNGGAGGSGSKTSCSDGSAGSDYGTYTGGAGGARAYTQFSTWYVSNIGGAGGGGAAYGGNGSAATDSHAYSATLGGGYAGNGGNGASATVAGADATVYGQGGQGGHGGGGGGSQPGIWYNSNYQEPTFNSVGTGGNGSAGGAGAAGCIILYI